jgi:autotransporter-associated beta strand protein
MPTVYISSTISGGSLPGSGAAASVGGITLQNITLNDGGGSGATASATLSPNITLNSNRGISLTASGGTLYQTPGTTFTIAGPISSTGNGPLTKSGPGTLIFGGANTYTGQTTVSAGTLAVSGALATLGTSNVVVQGTAAGTALAIQSGVNNAIDDRPGLSGLRALDSSKCQALRTKTARASQRLSNRTRSLRSITSMRRR